jgi:hypothetical protein
VSATAINSCRRTVRSSRRRSADHVRRSRCSSTRPQHVLDVALAHHLIARHRSRNLTVTPSGWREPMWCRAPTARRRE